MSGSRQQYVPEATVEDLEVRRMMSGAAVTFEDGILMVRGATGKPNTITVTMVKGKVLASAGKAKLAVAVAAVLALRVDGGQKADIIDVSPLVKLQAYIDGKGGNDTIRTGGGSSTVLGRGGNDEVVCRGKKNRVYGGDGRNEVLARKGDDVYAGARGVVSGGAANRSLTEKNPEIPAPPVGRSEEPIANEPGEETEGTPGGGDGPTGEEPTPPKPVVEDVTDVTDPPPTPEGPGDPQVEEPETPKEPEVVDFGPVFNARDFGAKFDGVTNDGPAIQAALNAIPKTGGTLIIDGVAAVGFKALKVIGKDRLTIRASKAGDGFVSLARKAGDVLHFWSAAVTLQDCTNSVVSGLRFDGGGDSGGAVALINCTDTTVLGNEVFNTNGVAAIVASHGERNRFAKNTIHDTAEGCRGLWIGNVWEEEMEESPLIEGNTILRAGASGIAGHHLGAVIRNNVVRDAKGAGITLGGYYNAAINYRAVTQDTLVQNNVLTGNLFHGIQSDVFAGQEYTERVTVEGNFVADNLNAGVYAVRTSGWVIRNNVIQDNGSGILLGRTFDATISGNTIVSTRKPGKLVQSDGILVWASGTLAGNAVATATNDMMIIQNVTIQGNTCTGNDRSGIRLDTFNGGKADNIRVLNNTLSGQTWDGLHITDKGIAGLLTRITYEGNTCTNNTRHDVNVTLTAN